ncbi:MAG: tripartite tricarboxylate transporter TctB family protein [Deltaproteobacteria bacterium]|nr:tripartite tricarboxylate transporter TctB family protein [Deltaproteobacteria bacterium]
MKGSTTGSRLLGVILVAASLLFFAWSFSYGGMAGFVPLVLAFPTVVLAALCLAGERYPAIMSAFEVSLEDVLAGAATGEHDVEESEAQEGPKAGELKLIVRMFVWFGVFGVLVFISGFYISTLLFAVFFTRYQGRIGWPGTVFITALALGFFYFIFEETLAVDLFAGVIFGAFIPPL